MPELPPQPDLQPLRRQAQELLRAVRTGDTSARQRLGPDETLAAAQHLVAREHGFASWPLLEREVERREILDDRDLGRLRQLLHEDQTEATRALKNWRDHPRGASPLGYLAMLPYDTARGVWRRAPGTGALARALIEAGAPVEGEPGDPETPLITAASYGNAEVAQVLIEAGANLQARSSPDSGGVPGGTALLHAAVFGMTEVVNLLVAAGAKVEGIELAAAAGDVSAFVADAPEDARIRALVMAAAHERIGVITELIEASTPVDAVDDSFGGHPLREAASQGRPAAVERLLAHGADPNLQDERGYTALDHARRARGAHDDQTRFDRVEAILAPRARPKPNPAKVRSTQAQGPSITVVIRATDFPGKACGPGPKGEMFDDIQVGLAQRRDTIELVSGGARGASWTFNMTVRRDDAGQLFGGPFVLGHKDDRHFGLRWVTTSMEEELEVFRVAKLRLADIDRGLLEAALREKRDLIADVAMTDRDGMPICARVRPPFVKWSLSG